MNNWKTSKEEVVYKQAEQVEEETEQHNQQYLDRLLRNVYASSVCRRERNKTGKRKSRGSRRRRAFHLWQKAVIEGGTGVITLPI